MSVFGASAIQTFFAVTLIILALFTTLRINFSEAPTDEEQTDFVVMNETSPVVLEMSPQMTEQN